jgi:hypothetical protein
MTIFMKSGNKLFSDCVTEYSYVPAAHGLAKLQLTQDHKPGKTKILVQTLVIDQIEGISVVDYKD